MYNNIIAKNYEYLQARCNGEEIRELYYYVPHIYTWLNPRRSICYSQ